MPITSQQVRALRAESHRLQLKPVVMIGNNGLSENVMQELEQALSHHELIKIRVPALDKADKKELIATICERTDSQLIQTIGFVAVLFRANPEKQRFAKLLK
ncbi:MAG: ribosome assembly RNA-binding protein YhbY [Gammaproteobacteria bacterium]|nr:ribosome assembly RNA-binding protein YhbY [Gammaproteobacteria bacterium]